MLKRMILFVFLACVAVAQQSTELYIPIGKSPGLSKENKTTIGKVESVSTNQVAVSGKIFKFTTKSKVFLDRSIVKKSNSYGIPSDISVHQLVEIFSTSENQITWIKIQTE